jgi:hypothetical protein
VLRYADPPTVGQTVAASVRRLELLFDGVGNLLEGRLEILVFLLILFDAVRQRSEHRTALALKAVIRDKLGDKFVGS